MNWIMVFILALLSSVPASAKTWPSVGHWHITEGDGVCAISATYQGNGETELAIILGGDGGIVAMARNYNWTTKDGEAYDITWQFDKTEYSGASRGSRSGLKNGFVKKFNNDFLNDFSSSSALTLLRGDVVVDSLKLTGSAAALTVGKQCQGHMKAEAKVEAQEKSRLSAIPDNPFADASPPPDAAPTNEGWGDFLEKLKD